MSKKFYEIPISANSFVRRLRDHLWNDPENRLSTVPHVDRLLDINITEPVEFTLPTHGSTLETMLARGEAWFENIPSDTLTSFIDENGVHTHSLSLENKSLMLSTDARHSYDDNLKVEIVPIGLERVEIWFKEGFDAELINKPLYDYFVKFLDKQAQRFERPQEAKEQIERKTIDSSVKEKVLFEHQVNATTKEVWLSIGEYCASVFPLLDIGKEQFPMLLEPAEWDEVYDNTRLTLTFQWYGDTLIFHGTPKGSKKMFLGSVEVKQVYLTNPQPVYIKINSYRPTFRAFFLDLTQVLREKWQSHIMQDQHTKEQIQEPNFIIEDNLDDAIKFIKNFAENYSCNWHPDVQGIDYSPIIFKTEEQQLTYNGRNIVIKGYMGRTMETLTELRRNRKYLKDPCMTLTIKLSHRRAKEVVAFFLPSQVNGIPTGNYEIDWRSQGTAHSIAMIFYNDLRENYLKSKQETIADEKSLRKIEMTDIDKAIEKLTEFTKTQRQLGDYRVSFEKHWVIKDIEQQDPLWRFMLIWQSGGTYSKRGTIKIDRGYVQNFVVLTLDGVEPAGALVDVPMETYKAERQSLWSGNRNQQIVDFENGNSFYDPRLVKDGFERLCGEVELLLSDVESAVNNNRLIQNEPDGVKDTIEVTIRIYPDKEKKVLIPAFFNDLNMRKRGDTKQKVLAYYFDKNNWSQSEVASFLGTTAANVKKHKRELKIDDWRSNPN